MSLTHDEVADIVSQGAVELARRIAAGEVSSRDVVEAHIRQVDWVNPKINALVVPCFETARAEADAIDQARSRGEKLGPLAGVPVTIKECFCVKGTQATIGVDHFVGDLADEDGPLVKRLRAAGAIIFGKTNVPQLMVLHETDNPVYGRTNNPWWLKRAPGGSSGGEAAIICAGGSPLGLGSDLGGSIRVPAHVCGVTGIKPTSGRLTSRGSRGNFYGMESLRGSPGPMARKVEDLDVALRVLCDEDTDELDEIPLPLRDFRQVDISKLRVGIWTDDGYFAASPAIRRAVEEAGQALEQLGARVLRFEPPDVAEAVAIYYGLVSADGARSLKLQMGSSEADPRVARLIRLGGFTGRIRTALGWWLESRGQDRLAALVKTTGPLSAYRYWLLTHERSLYIRKFFTQWQSEKLDVLLCPSHALPALKHGTSVDLTTAASYCFVINMLDVPSGSVPITKVRDNEESDREESRDQVERTARRVEKGSAGLPVGVQVSAGMWREDVVLAVMSALEKHFCERDDYPRWVMPDDWRTTFAETAEPDGG